MPARYAVERGEWQEAAQLQPLGEQVSRSPRRSRISRERSAPRAAATSPRPKRMPQELAALHKALLAAKNTYWATEVEVQRLAAAGWIAHAQGKSDEALKFMRAAADLEDRNEKHIVTPGRVVPARELLGDMLLELKQPAQALKEFEASQLREPNRFRNYAGAARAAEMAGDTRQGARVLREAVGAREEWRQARGPELAQREASPRRGELWRRRCAPLSCAAFAAFAAGRRGRPGRGRPGSRAKRDDGLRRGQEALEAEELERGGASASRRRARASRQRRPAQLPRLRLPQPEAVRPRVHALQARARDRSAPPRRARVHRRGVPDDRRPPGRGEALAALRSICLLPCEELADLEKAIAKYRGAK